MKKTLAIAGVAGALTIGMAVPSFAQYYVHTVPHYGYYPNAVENGQCFVETDKTLGFGYWGSCAAKGQALGRGSGTYKTENLPYNPR
jgi:hypothetical protein